jgi:hypothetical protein
MKTITTFVLLAVSVTAHSQFKRSSIIYKNEKDYNDFSFPFIEGSNGAVSNAINWFLQTDMLECTLRDVPKKDLFNKIRYIKYPDSLSQSGYTHINYEIILNTNRVFSIRFDNESMGAYPENWKRYYCFDVSTGKVITPELVFTEKGKEVIAKLLMQQRDSIIKSWKKEINADYGDRNPEDSAWIAETFAECNADAGTNNFVITKNGLLFYKEYCFPHAARPYDTDLDIKFSMKFLFPYLSPAGKRLLQ